MEPELEPGFNLNYPVPVQKELPGFYGSGSEPGSITNSDGQVPATCEDGSMSNFQITKYQQTGIQLFKSSYF